jgi:hypothetical protein
LERKPHPAPHPLQGLYGELVQRSQFDVIEYLAEHCGLGPSTYFLDVGAGLGKAVLVAQQFGSKAFGVEYCYLRYIKSQINAIPIIQHSKKKDSPVRGNGLWFGHLDALDLRSFDPMTIVYMFDVGFPSVLLKALGETWNQSTSSHLVSFMKPDIMIDLHGYNMVCIHKMITKMHGSRQGHTVYFYKREGQVAVSGSAPDPLLQEATDEIERGTDYQLEKMHEKRAAWLNESRVFNSHLKSLGKLQSKICRSLTLYSDLVGVSRMDVLVELEKTLLEELEKTLKGEEIVLLLSRSREVCEAMVAVEESEKTSRDEKKAARKVLDAWEKLNVTHGAR